MTDNIFKTLSAVNVDSLSEKKGQFTYLSWTDAWTTLMEHYPDATHDMLDDVIYPDGTMEVRSSVTINGHTLKCFLPVIDHRNKAIEHPDAFAVNKNRMRCLAKNIALFGLGLYIFRGQDFPEEPEPVNMINDEQVQALCDMQSRLTDDNSARFWDWMGAKGVHVFDEVPASAYDSVKAALDGIYAKQYESEQAWTAKAMGEA